MWNKLTVQIHLLESNHNRGEGRRRRNGGRGRGWVPAMEIATVKYKKHPTSQSLQKLSSSLNVGKVVDMVYCSASNFSTTTICHMLHFCAKQLRNYWRVRHFFGTTVQCRHTFCTRSSLYACTMCASIAFCTPLCKSGEKWPAPINRVSMKCSARAAYTVSM